MMKNFADDSSSVIVAVLTYQRADDLAALVPILISQAAQQLYPVGILVIDNDPAGSAGPYAESLAGAVRYVHEPRPGIATARNRAIDEAGDAELLIFIDDDERPVDDWLASLLTTYRSWGADAVVGPVASIFTGELDPWIAAGGFFTRRRFPTGATVTVAATNNLLLRLEAVRSRGIRFDPSLGMIGGEDTLFTRQLTNGGGKMVWCAEAMVHDIVPADRMTRSWVLARAFRMGGSASCVEVTLASTVLQRCRVRTQQAALGLSRIFGGLARMAFGSIVRSQGLRAAGARNCARGLGLVGGVFGFVYAEYRR